MAVTFDIDIDFANRENVLQHIKHFPASIHRTSNQKDEWVKHNTGVYVTDIPYDPLNKFASIDFNEAEQLGYMKIDMLNVSVYEKVRDEQHLLRLMNTEPLWERLGEREFVEQVIHINNHFEAIHRMPEEINSIPRLAMFLAIIRPAKRHLVGKAWKDVAADVWTKPADDSYHFKKSHSCAYAHLIAVHMNLICEK